MSQDARFKELLNLHLDHRLGAEDACELERMLKSSPELRRTFRSYALMQRGCSELFRRSEADAPAPDALVRALRDVEARMQPRPLRRERFAGWATWTATAGVAAAVALMVARVSRPVGIADGSRESSPVLAASNPVTPLTAGFVSTAVVVPRHAALPSHLTLAALGIQPERGEPASLSRWTPPTEQTEVAELAQASEPVWARATLAGSTTSMPAHFNGRPINVWAAQSGVQVQNASFTFER